MADYAPSSAPNAIPPGWYADPLTNGQARWWSGQDWTHHVHEVPVAAPRAADVPVRSGGRSRGRIPAVIAGVVAVAILTLVGIYTNQPW